MIPWETDTFQCNSFEFLNGRISLRRIAIHVLLKRAGRISDSLMDCWPGDLLPVVLTACLSTWKWMGLEDY